MSRATRVAVTNGNVENALKRFKVEVQRSGIPSEVKKRKEYVSRTKKRKLEKAKAIKNSRKKNKRNR